MESKERRSTPRQPIKLAAQLDLGTGHPLPCQISDFCAEGMYIRYSDATSRKVEEVFATEPPRELVVRFRGPEANRSYELFVTPTRRVPGAMGVSYTRPAIEAVNAMLALCGASQHQEGAPDRPALKAPSDRVQFVLHQAARTITQYIEPLMDACVVQMATELRDKASKAGHDQQANDFIDAAGQIDSRQRVIWHQMASSLQSPLKPEPKGAPGAALSVVDKNEFEEWLAVRVMVTRADTRYRGELLQLKLRLDHLQIANRTGHHNPLGPALVSEAFHNALAQLDLTREVEKTCLQVFEQTVLRELGPMYRELNQILIRQGVLPDLDLSRYLSEKPAVSRPAPEPEPEARPEPEPRPEPSSISRASGDFRGHSASARTAFATVRNLLASLQASRSEGGSVTPPQPAVTDGRPLSLGELHRELQELQLQVDEDYEAVSLKERVLGKLGERPTSAALDSEQTETLDVVDQFFHSVLASPKLGDQARGIMRRLEVPVLKVVMRDQSFFEDRNSPVRAVMNRLAQLGSQGARINPVLQRRVDELVHRIAVEFEQDATVFEQTLAELDTLVERQEQVYRRNVERVTAAAEGAQKVAESRAVVNRAINSKIAGRSVPRVLLTLLDGGWRDLLSLVWLRQGPDSYLWADYLGVIDSLLAHADDPGQDIDLPELVRITQDGLASISGNQVPSARIRDELKQFLVRAPDSHPDLVDIPPEPAEPSPTESGHLSELERRGLQRWVTRARDLSIGSWLKDQTRPEQPQYIRLVWIAQDQGRFVFVNQQGMRVVELSLAALAQQMREGRIVPDTDYDRPLVDESIDRMVHKTYDQLAWAVRHDQLTGLLNRREFELVLDQRLAGREENLALLYLDLRGFRLLNDTAGYQAGDEVLKRLADILCQHAEPGRPVARLAGNEFAMLVPAGQGNTIARALIGAVEAEAFGFGGNQYALSANVGLVPDLPVLTSGERWLRASEQALAAARKQGEGTIAEYVPDEAEQARQEQIAARLANLRDPADERVLLRCQKIIPLHPGARLPSQYEILISMYDDSGQLITGHDFIRMAERYNRMHVVDRWVVGYMIDWLRDAKPDSQAVAGVCINLSGQSLNDQSLLEFIYEKLSERDAPIERLWFEIMDASAIHDLPAVAGFMQEIKELGCRFCLGNFGTGPGSFQMMRSLPVDLIKIDNAFTGRITFDKTDQTMVRSMVEMAHYMQREVIASHVESREALDLLVQLGVDYAQGFAIEKTQLLDSLI
ncbi:MAG TPA: DUF1631 family protein [Marinobacter sp.]|nr:DUF1631 family protein [Marinobacter sp.]